MSLAYYTIIYKNIMSEIAFETLFIQSTEQRQQNLQPLSSKYDISFFRNSFTDLRAAQNARRHNI